MKMRPLVSGDLAAIQAFTDRTIGQGYYSSAELADILQRSTKNGVVFSLLLEDEQGEVRGIRITYPPGQWSHGKGHGLCPEKWNSPLSETAFFQSLFIEPSLTGQGWGKQLSLESMRLLKAAGTKAVVCHSWKESPGDSSGKYLRSMGFATVATHPLYWKDVDYTCTRCGKPCLCTAEEMIKYL